MTARCPFLALPECSWTCHLHCFGGISNKKTRWRDACFGPPFPSDPSKRGANRSTCVRCDHVARAPHWPRQGTHLKSARNVAFPPARRMRKKNRAGFLESGNELAVSLIPGLRNSFPFFFLFPDSPTGVVEEEGAFWLVRARQPHFTLLTQSVTHYYCSGST